MFDLREEKPPARLNEVQTEPELPDEPTIVVVVGQDLVVRSSIPVENSHQAVVHACGSDDHLFWNCPDFEHTWLS